MVTHTYYLLRLSISFFSSADSLEGVPIAYSDPKLASSTGMIIEDLPEVHFHVHTNVTLFSPSIGTRLTGVVNNMSPDHIGLLIQGIFNASIGHASIPAQFEFVDGQWTDKDYDTPRCAFVTAPFLSMCIACVNVVEIT